MPQTITMADVRRGWVDCNTCGDTLRIFYHHRCPTCHTEFTVPTVPPAEKKEQDPSIGEASETRDRSSPRTTDEGAKG